MDTPSAVAEVIGEEEVHAHVALEGPGADALYVTPARTVAYDGEGLLSDESVTGLPHDAERVTVSEGRRKATITLSYGIDEDRSVVVPAGQVDEALHPLLAGVLAARGITGDGETIGHTYRFNELTLVVTSQRVVKHVGGAVWDEAEHEEIALGDVLDLGIEEGEVSTQLVIGTTRRQERIKTPAEGARQVHADIEDALLAYHGVDSYDQFREAVAFEDADGGSEAGDTSGFVESGLDPISMSGGSSPDSPETTADRSEPSPDPSETVADRPEAAADDAGADPDQDTQAEPGRSGAAAGADTGDVGSAEPEESEGFAGSAFESAAAQQAVDPEAVEAELRALDDALARQADLIEEQRGAVEALLEELDVD